METRNYISTMKKEVGLNASTLDVPSFLLNAPFGFSIKDPNNVWMKEAIKEDPSLQLNKKNAMLQWLDLYNYLAAGSLVYIQPSLQGLQDQVFTANLGIVLNHLEEKDKVIISNFTSEPRYGETPVSVQFFESMGYKALVCPFKFEGEADLKHIKDNIYIGGYGIRSDIRAYEWMEENFDMKIIKVKMNNEYLYHLDCSIFPLTKDELLIADKIYSPAEIKEISKYININSVEEDDCLNGITNCIRFHNSIINASYISEIDRKKDKDEYEWELAKNRTLEDICSDLGLEPVFVNLSEFMKGGALLSCLVMHLNRQSYNIDTI